MWRAVVIATLTFVAAGWATAQPQEEHLYHYRATVIDVYDGDTFTVA